MIIKFDSKLSAVSPFKYYFLHEASQTVSLNCQRASRTKTLNVRQEQIQCPRHKIDTKLNKRVHHTIEQACSRIETVYVFRLCLPISN